MAGTVERKSRKSSSTSSIPELCESDEVLTTLNMAGEVIPKLEQVLEKLENLEQYVKAVDEKGSDLQAKVDCSESGREGRKDQRA